MREEEGVIWRTDERGREERVEREDRGLEREDRGSPHE